ncbi:hypothetical protein ACHAXS_001638 [Conticribra weissflogii]
MKLFKKKQKASNNAEVASVAASKITSAPTSDARKSSITQRMKKKLHLNRSKRQKSSTPAVEQQVPADLARDREDESGNDDVHMDGRDEKEVSRHETREQEKDKTSSDEKDDGVCEPKNANKEENIKESPAGDVETCADSKNEVTSVESTKSVGSGGSGRGSSSSSSNKKSNKNNNENVNSNSESNTAVDETQAAGILPATVESSSVRAPSPSPSVKSCISIKSVTSQISTKSAKSSGSLKSGQITLDDSETIESMTAFAGVASSKLNASILGEEDLNDVVIGCAEKTGDKAKESVHSDTEVFTQVPHDNEEAYSSESNESNRGAVSKSSSQGDQGSVRSSRSNRSVGSLVSNRSNGNTEYSNLPNESLNTEDTADATKGCDDPETDTLGAPKEEEASVKSTNSNRSTKSHKSVISTGSKQSIPPNECSLSAPDAESNSECTGLHVLLEENEFEVEVESVPVVVTKVVTVLEEEDGGCEMLVEEKKLSSDVDVVGEMLEKEQCDESGMEAKSEKQESQEATVVDKKMKGERNIRLKNGYSAANDLIAPLHMPAPAQPDEAASLMAKDQAHVKCDDTITTEGCSVKTEKSFDCDTQKLVSASFHGGLKTIARISSGVEEAADAVGKTILVSGVPEVDNDDDDAGSDYPGVENTGSKSSRDNYDGYGTSVCGLSLGCHEALMGAGEAVHSYVGDADEDTKGFLRRACDSAECAANASEEDLKAQFE